MITTTENSSFMYSGGNRMPGAVLWLGRGIDQNGQPSEGTLNRANAVIEFYRQNGVDPEEVPLVLSGGYSASLPEAPANGKTEAGCAQELFAEAGIAVKSIEDGSTCTFTNFANVVEGNHLGGMNFTRRRPLALGAGYEHYLRSSHIARAAFNLGQNAIVNIAPQYEDGPVGHLKERVGIFITRWALHGQETGPDGAMTYDGLMAAQRRFELVGPNALRALNKSRAARATA